MNEWTNVNFKGKKQVIKGESWYMNIIIIKKLNKKEI